MTKTIRLVIIIISFIVVYNVVEAQQSIFDDPNIQRIIGGTKVKKNTYPWFARAITKKNGSWEGCGGFLVTPEFVLTAAHCIGKNFKQKGGYQIGALCSPYKANNNCGQGMETFGIKTIYSHPNYNSKTSANDFALVQLDGTSSITPVAMDQGSYSPNYTNGKDLWTIGFGKLKNSGNKFPKHLMHVKVNYVTNAQCNQKYNNSNQIKVNMMCASAPNKDSCNGDSGGPLYDTSNKVMVGVVSWGNKCASPKYPGVYARISNQWNWIDDKICSNHSPNTKPDFCGGEPPKPTPPKPTPPSPTPPSPTPPTSDCPAKRSKFELEFKTDRYGKDTYWSLQMRKSNKKFKVVQKGGYDTFYGNNKVIKRSYCILSSKCYRFNMFDEEGDGMCCDYGNGYYKFSFKGKQVKYSKMQNMAVQKTLFGNC